MTQRFLVYYRVPSLNDALNAAKGHWSAWARLKRKASADILIQMRAQKPRAMTGTVEVRFRWGIKRGDLDNIAAVGAKIVLDVLQEAGVIKDDTIKTVRAITHEVDESLPPGTFTVEVRQAASTKV